MNIKSVLIIRGGALGDLVYSTSVIDALKYEFGEEVIVDFVCTPANVACLKDDKRVHKVFTLKHKKIPVIFSKDKKDIINSSKNLPYDLLINFEFSKYFKSLLNNIVAKKKIGAMFDEIVLNQKVNRAELIKSYLTAIVSKENLEKANPRIMTLDIDVIKKKFTLDDSYIVISPTNSHIKKSGINYRAWKNEKWKQLINELSKKMQVVLVGAKGEEFFFKDLKPFPKNTLSLVGKNSILELSSVVKDARAVICTDSALGHIAAAVNTPVFVLMGPNDTIEDSPYQTPFNKVHVISAKLSCSPCYKTPVMKACSDNICMKSITVQMVLEKLYTANIVHSYTNTPQINP